MDKNSGGRVGAAADVAQGSADDEDEDGDQGETILDMGNGKNDGGKPEAKDGLQRSPKQNFFAEASAQSDNEPFAYRVEITE